MKKTLDSIVGDPFTGEFIPGTENWQDEIAPILESLMMLHTDNADSISSEPRSDSPDSWTTVGMFESFYYTDGLAVILTAEHIRAVFAGESTIEELLVTPERFQHLI